MQRDIERTRVCMLCFGAAVRSGGNPRTDGWMGHQQRSLCYGYLALWLRVTVNKSSTTGHGQKKRLFFLSSLSLSLSPLSFSCVFSSILSFPSTSSSPFRHSPLSICPFCTFIAIHSSCTLIARIDSAVGAQRR